MGKTNVFSTSVWSFWRLLWKHSSWSFFCHLASSSFLPPWTKQPPYNTIILNSNRSYITEDDLNQSRKPYILHKSRAYCKTVVLKCIFVMCLLVLVYLICWQLSILEVDQEWFNFNCINLVHKGTSIRLHQSSQLFSANYSLAQ